MAGSNSKGCVISLMLAHCRPTLWHSAKRSTSIKLISVNLCSFCFLKNNFYILLCLYLYFRASGNIWSFPGLSLVIAYIASDISSLFEVEWHSPYYLALVNGVFVKSVYSNYSFKPMLVYLSQYLETIPKYILFALYIA